MKKQEAFKKRETGGVVYTYPGYFDYHTAKGYADLLGIISKSHNPSFCEAIDGNDPIILFFDIEQKKKDEDIQKLINEYGCLERVGFEAVNLLLVKTEEILKDYHISYHALSSHQYDKNTQEMIKFSIHLMVRFKSSSDTEVMFRNTKALNNFIGKHYSHLPKWVYDRNCIKNSGFLFRTVHSNKVEKDNSIPRRPLIPFSNDFFEKTNDFRDYFLCYQKGEKMEFFPDEENHGGLGNYTNGTDLAENSKRNDFFRITTPLLVDLARSILASFGLKFNLEIKKMLEVKSCSGVEPSIIIGYDGECQIKKKRHKNNHCYLLITEKYLFFRCHDAKCRSNTKWLRKNVITDEQFALFIRNDSCTEFDVVNDYIKTVDAGVKVLEVVDDVYVATASDELLEKYEAMKLGLHKINKKNHFIIKDSVEVEIEEWRTSGTLNKFVLLSDCVFTINTTNNFFNGEYDGTLTNEKNFLHTEWIQDLMKSYLRQEPTGKYINVNNELMKWADKQTPDSLGKFAGKMLAFLNAKKVDAGLAWWDEKKWCMEGSSDILKSRLLDPVVGLFDDLDDYTANILQDKQIFCEVRKLREFSQSGSRLSLFFSHATRYLSINSNSEDFNQNWDVVPFSNGAYELGKEWFRKNLPDDLNNFNLSFNYITSPSYDIFKILEPIFPIKEELDFVLDIFASALDDKIPNDRCFFFVGNGNNGKTILTRLMKRVFGTMCVCLPSSFFSLDSSNHGTASPQIEHLRNARIAFVSEPENGKLRTPLIKKFCGGEDINSRQLYQSKINEFDMRTKFVVSANRLPAFSEGDDAVWKRVVVVYFSTKFVENPTKTNERISDPDLAKKITTDPKLWESVMFELLQRKRGLTSARLRPPQAFLAWKQKAEKIENRLPKWFSENIKWQEKGWLTGKEIYGRYYEEDESEVDYRSSQYRSFIKALQIYIGEMELTDEKSEFKTVKSVTKRINNVQVRGFNNLVFVMKEQKFDP